MREAPRNGGGVHLADRVATALRTCRDTIGTEPTATTYGEWRKALPPDIRATVPSLTSVCPIAFATWRDAREAAGITGGKDRSLPVGRGPKPVWSAEDCIDTVREWLLKSDGPKTFAGYSSWVEQRRAEGDMIPSVSTVRLRLRLPWSGIVALAEPESGVSK
jgi:hypothetical protein